MLFRSHSAQIRLRVGHEEQACERSELELGCAQRNILLQSQHLLEPNLGRVADRRRTLYRDATIMNKYELQRWKMLLQHLMQLLLPQRMARQISKRHL